MGRRILRRAGEAYLAAVILILGVAILLVLVAVARPQTFWTPDGDDVGRSLEHAGDGFTVVPAGCHSVGRATWACPVEDDPGSGPSGEYRLRVRPDNCWSASRRGRLVDGRRRLNGCVGFGDFVGF